MCVYVFMIFGVPRCVIGFTDICVGITWITCNYDVKNTDAVFISDSFQYLPFTFVKYSCVCFLLLLRIQE